jgi:DNA-binding transcriptional regulator YhcF (GntR family)
MITVDPGSPVAPYEQVRLAIAYEVRSGSLPPGARLPTVRRLATDLGLAPNTVARAYRELEQDHVVETRGRHGTFVSTAKDPVERQAFAATTEYVERLRRLGVELDHAVAMLTATYRSDDRLA